MLRKLLWTGLCSGIGAAATMGAPPKLKPSLMVARGPNPFLVVGIALAAGIALAKIVDWRSHAHPRD